MSQLPAETSYDATVMEFSESADRQKSDLPFPAVAVAPGRQTPLNAPYLAQQTSFDEYTPGLNPLVNAASLLLLEIVKLRTSSKADLQEVRARLEAEVRGFSVQAMASGISEAQVNAAQYLLCTALDESVTTSNISDAAENWQQKSLLSTFHKDTWGGEVFFDVLSRTMEQPASRLYLLELIYLLLSLGFEGKYRSQERGALALESLRDQLYRQIRLLRGEPEPNLSRKLDTPPSGSKVYAYIPFWIIGMVVVVCLAVTYFGFSHTLNGKGQPLAARYSSHVPSGKPYIGSQENGGLPAREKPEENSGDADEKPQPESETSPAVTVNSSDATSAKEIRP